MPEEVFRPGRPRVLSPFRSREYRLLAASLAASLTAGGMWLVALVSQVVALGGGPTQLSLVAASASAGLVLAALAGGIAADRYPRRTVLIVVETARTAVGVVAAVLSLTGTLSLGRLVAIAFVIGVAEGFFYPAFAASLPSVLPEDDLLAANGFEGVLRPAAQQAAGPALAALAATVFSPGVALAAAAAGYLLALVPLPFLRRRTVTTRARSSVVDDFREGVVYLRRTGWLFATLAFAVIAVLVVMGPIEVLVPFAVRDRTGTGTAGYAAVLVAYGLGGAIGSLFVATRRPPRRYLTAILLLWGLGSVPLVLLGTTHLLCVMVVATFLVGITDTAAQVLWETVMQLRVPRHLLGRVTSLDFFVSLALMPLSMALAGPVGEAIGLPLTFGLSAAIPVVVAVAVIIGWRLYRDEIAHPLAAPPDRDVRQDTVTTP